MYKSMDLRKACCHIRKMEPLERALAGQRAWITGLRREQSQARAEVPLIDTTDEGHQTGRVKFNPLANWTWGDVWHYIAPNQRGLQPAARRVFPQHRLRTLHPRHQPGRRLPRRALVVGRRIAAKECGLHVKNNESNEKVAA
jgi:phosphoadenosine phosphosulfate reductase